MREIVTTTQGRRKDQSAEPVSTEIRLLTGSALQKQAVVVMAILGACTVNVNRAVHHMVPEHAS